MTALRLNKASAAVLAVGALLGGAMIGAGHADREIEQAKPIKIGQKAPDFTLTDLQGNEHTLSEYTQAGKTVVLEWFSPECPFVKKHYRPDTGTMLKIQEDVKEEPVVWLRINSARKGHPSTGVEANKKAAEQWGITSPILLDESGEVGLSFNAKRTPEMYIIDSSGTLAYHGAIDNRRDAAAPGDVNYVSKALHEVLAGETVTTAETKAYGCSIKY